MSRHRRLRDHVPFTPRHEPYFRWRGREVSRLEGFADAVFAFAVTLLIVALEVPHTFDGLVDTLRGFPAFTACFVMLMVFWNAHYRFFRRYGLEDMFTRIVNLVILLIVLFSVYPLKFLFGAVLTFGSAHTPHIETWEQLRFVYTVFGLGFIGIWALYTLLYVHALRLRHVLDLTPGEVVQTRAALTSFTINIVVCLLSVGLAQLDVSPGLPGFTYFLLAPLLTFNGRWHGRQVRALSAQEAATPD